MTHQYIHCPHCFGIDLEVLQHGYSGSGGKVVGPAGETIQSGRERFIVDYESGVGRCNECQKTFTFRVEYSEHKDGDVLCIPMYPT